MAMADAKGSLDYWRKFLGCAKSDIFDLIENAIYVAAVDCPKELNVKRNLIAEKLYTSQFSSCSKCNCDNLVENDEIVGEVMRKKEVLRNHQHESDSVLYESLRYLQLMTLSVETLKRTEIGRAVNALRKHNSTHIRKLVRVLIDGWKVAVDEWLKSATPITENTTTVSDSEQKESSHLSVGVKRKQSEEVSEMSKLENAKRKLHEGYQRVENAKKLRRIQIIELHDLPNDSLEKQRPKKKVGNQNGKRQSRVSKLQHLR